MHRGIGFARSAVLAIAFACAGERGWTAPPEIAPATPATQPAALPKPAGTDPPPTTVKQMLTATRITYQCKNYTPQAAIELLEQMVGFNMRPPTEEGVLGGRGKVTCDLQNQPLLVVVKNICEQGDLVISRSASRIAAPIVVNERSTESADCFYPKVTDTSLMPIVTRLSPINNNSMRPGGPPSPRKLFVNISLVAEPKVNIVGYYRPTLLDSVIDDQNRSLVPPPGQPAMGMGMNRQTGKPYIQYCDGIGDVNTSVSILYPPAPAVSIKRLRGSIRVVLGFNVQTRDLTAALEDGKTASLPFLKTNGITFSDFLPDMKEEQGYIMTMSIPRIRLPNGLMVEQSPDVAELRFEAIDAENQRWRVRKGPSRLTQNSQAQFTLTLRPPSDAVMNGDRLKPPTKFLVMVPGRTEECDIPFEFNDLPIPAEQPK